MNNFDCALLVQDGVVKSVEKVSARGREAPLLQATDNTRSVAYPQTTA